MDKQGRKELKGWDGGNRSFRPELNFTGGAREARGLDGAKERKWKEKRIVQPEGSRRVASLNKQDEERKKRLDRILQS